MNPISFSRYSWFLVFYNVLVILWGAVVRATGSGAGCGNHWPLCNGEVVPTAQHLETTIEFTHRITSALDGLLVIGLVIFAFIVYQKKSLVRRWAIISLTFIIIEGMLGRTLVVQDWVADNVSIARAIVVSIHLVNTYLLLASLAITAWLSTAGVEISWRRDRLANWLLGVALISVMLFSAMGAVTALGDTLFPSESLLADIKKDFDPTSNFLIQLRVIHPILAIITGFYLLYVLRFLRTRLLGKKVTRLTSFILALMVIQGAAGFITILTLAPIYMQILHLLLADTFWLTLTLLTLEVFTTSQTSLQDLEAGA
jgi:heme A synthase